MAIVLVSLGGTPLLAQGTGGDEAPRPRLQLGFGLKSTIAPGADTTSATTPDVVWRWRGRGRRTDAHWSPSFGLSSLRSQVSSLVGTAPLPVGNLRARPVMAGIDYNIPHGRWQWALGASVGWSFNRIDTPRTYHHRAAIAAGTTDLWVDVDNSVVWGPRVRGWYDVNPRLSFLVESAYLMTRPMLALRANGQTTASRLTADTLVIKMGVAYGVF